MEEASGATIITPIKIHSSVKCGNWKRGFSVEILYPGTAFKGGDSGIGAIGRIDLALIQPGHVIARATSTILFGCGLTGRSVRR
ncbi:hypothetical protein [Sphingobium sp. HWE2-09]|uniref:hypothetical protein n=1 Tax=Sphingobium sp. HWE2-09 TaxID=3108390 RepID=UPI002DC18D5C|nr:hypothetical protein [Sphingobium sp. HWE2-09]